MLRLELEMYVDGDDSLRDASAAVARKGELRSDRVRLADEMSQASYRLKMSAAQLEYTRAEIERLEQPGLLSFLGSLFGGSTARLEKYRGLQGETERGQAEAERVLREVEAQLGEVERQIGALGDVEAAYATTFEAKLQTVAQGEHEGAESIHQVSAEMDRLAAEVRKTDAAVDAVDGALKRVQGMKGALKRARRKRTFVRCGLVDMAWNATQRQFARPHMSRLREGLAQVDARISALDLSMDGDEAAVIGTAAVQADTHAATLDGNWTANAMGDYGAANAVEDDLGVLLRHLNDRRERLDRDRAALEIKRRGMVEQL